MLASTSSVSGSAPRASTICPSAIPSLAADPASASCREQHRRIYAIADQSGIRKSSTACSTPFLSHDGFYRTTGTLRTDRTLIDFSLNLGPTVKEALVHRDDDTFGVEMGFARVSCRAGDPDSDSPAFTGTLTQRASAKPFVPGCVRLPVHLQPRRRHRERKRSTTRPLPVRTNRVRANVLF